MLCKLALGNFKKSAKEFLIYFLTLAFGVCLFYAFNSIDAQQSMLQISESQNNMVKSLVSIIGYISIFISIILAFLILYANRFLIKRRKKEFGIYMTLGMRKNDIAKILTIETLIIGIFSLAVGLLAGIFVSQGLSVLTAKLFEVNLTAFKFIFSMAAFKKTILYFGIIFLIVMIFDAISVSRYKLIDLIYANKKNEKLRFKKLWLPVLLFITSIGILVLAYCRIMNDGITNITDKAFLITIILGCIGTLLFFMSLAGFLLKLIQMNKKVYYKNLNMFVLRQINSKINTNFISMTVVCLMLFVTIVTLAGGASFSSVFSKDIKESNPYDASLTIRNSDMDKNFDESAILKKYKIDLSKVSNNYSTINTYSIENMYYSNILSGVEDSKKINFAQASKSNIEFIKLSEFNKAIKIQEKNELKLNDNQFYILCNMDEIKKYCNNFLTDNGKLTINSKQYTSASNTVINYTLQDYAMKMNIEVIVPDEVLDGCTKIASTIDINYINNDSKYEQEYKDIIEKSNIYNETSHFYTNSLTKKTMYEQSVGLKVMIMYIAIYIGIIFLITSAAVLALQQLTEASDNVERYGLLKKIGAEKSMLNKAIFTQIGIYFLVPLSLAIVHSIIGIKVLNDTLVLVGQTGMLLNIFVTAVIIVLIYGGYMLATYVGAKNMINSNN